MRTLKLDWGTSFFSNTRRKWLSNDQYLCCKVGLWMSYFFWCWWKWGMLGETRCGRISLRLDSRKTEVLQKVLLFKNGGSSWVSLFSHWMWNKILITTLSSENSSMTMKERDVAPILTGVVLGHRLGVNKQFFLHSVSVRRFFFIPELLIVTGFRVAIFIRTFSMMDSHHLNLGIFSFLSGVLHKVWTVTEHSAARFRVATLMSTMSAVP